LTTVLFEKGENNRFKFFLEPEFFVFLVSRLYLAGKAIQNETKRMFSLSR